MAIMRAKNALSIGMYEVELLLDIGVSAPF
jgi:hypothetical protein